ncbi:hypothetical protein RHOFW510R12_01145 [Rhodanobacter sp. FW510-R12]|uniref:hypothetical protein n=1 Tax=Rhodanobacter thiooxydans TaxID=416169 RepID=UPI00090F69DC|nr:hypothetical protein [Rhodanobacter thiooxydans]UJJ56655.1 hypothetical protein LRK53_18780 [Rhodanobacter thiooxydans]
MTLMSAAAMPLFYENLAEDLPPEAGQRLRQALCADKALNDGLVSGLRRAFAASGATPTDSLDRDRRAFILRCMSMVLDPFAPPSFGDGLNWQKPEYLAMLEACALFSAHLMRDLFARFGQVSGAADADKRDGVIYLNGRPLSPTDVAERILMVYQLTHVEAMERVLEAAWAERTNGRYTDRAVALMVDGRMTWLTGRDAFSAGPDGLIWQRSGTTWFGQGYVFGSRPEVVFADQAVMRMNHGSVQSTKDLWRAASTRPQLVQGQ